MAGERFFFLLGGYFMPYVVSLAISPLPHHPLEGQRVVWWYLQADSGTFCGAFLFLCLGCWRRVCLRTTVIIINSSTVDVCYRRGVVVRFPRRAYCSQNKYRASPFSSFACFVFFLWRRVMPHEDCGGKIARCGGGVLS